MESHTKSMVATSEAVVLQAGPAFGFGIRAIATEPLSMTSRKTLLNPPLASFIMDTQDCATTLSAAMRWSSCTLKTTKRSRC